MAKETTMSRLITNSTRFALIAAVVFCGAPSVGTVDITVAADRVLIGPEFLPRRTDLPNNLIVPAGRTVELPSDGTFDYIEVAGTLRVSRTHDTTIRFTHLINLPGGLLDVGTVADPIPCGRRVEFIVRDVALDATRDPFQWGNGLVNFSKQTRVGCAKTTWTEAAGTLANGATSITLTSAPSNWQVGDELLVPDTATPVFDQDGGHPRRESTVTIAGITGATVTLSKPLDFEHRNITDPQGVVILRPRVANLTRNIVLRSENPVGSRGHSADVGHMASWDIRYNRFYGLGRTANAPFNDTVLGTHIGTNQRGRYTEHHHHPQSSPKSADVGNVYLGAGTPAGKWALVLHGTSDTRVEENIAVDFPGAGFVTEDGYEVRNVFRKNLAAYSPGNPNDKQGFDAQQNTARDCPGCDGAGFWFRGIINTFEANEAWNNFGSGINLFNQAHLPGLYPGAVGGAPDTAVKKLTARPLSFSDNITAANVLTGFEVWAVGPYPYRRLMSVNNLDRGIFAHSSDGIAVHLDNPTIICEVGQGMPQRGTSGIHSADGYVGTFDMKGGQVAGCTVGITGGGSANGINITGATLQNQVNIDRVHRHLLLQDVMHLPLANYPHRYILISSDGLAVNGAVWDGTKPLPRVGISLFTPNRGSDLVVKNWQGTGQDYRLFFRQSLGNNPAWYSASALHAWNPPVKGITMQEAWDQFGIGFGGDVLKESEALELDGIVYGLARAGLGVKFGPPRAIVTFPTLREPAILEGDGHNIIRIWASLTGDPSAASQVLMASVDGDRPFRAGESSADSPNEALSFGIGEYKPAYTAPGMHTIKVWRTQKANPNALLVGSEFVAQYVVSAAPKTDRIPKD
jgi:hypothetical protein